MKIVVVESPFMPQPTSVQAVRQFLAQEDGQRRITLDCRDPSWWSLLCTRAQRGKAPLHLEAGAHALIRERNTWYARAAMLDCLLRGEAPFLSHLLYGQVLDDDVPADRKLGMEAGIAVSWRLLEAPFLPQAEHVFYTELSVSAGMDAALGRMRTGAVALRKLDPEALAWYRDRVPTGLEWI